MEHAHYPLQALFYVVALHRYLRWRQPGYDPDVHLAGVLYLFLRGMVGADTPVVDGHPCGVFSWRPPAALIVAASDLLDRGPDRDRGLRRAGVDRRRRPARPPGNGAAARVQHGRRARRRRCPRGDAPRRAGTRCEFDDGDAVGLHARHARRHQVFQRRGLFARDRAAAGGQGDGRAAVLVAAVSATILDRQVDAGGLATLGRARMVRASSPSFARQ